MRGGREGGGGSTRRVREREEEEKRVRAKMDEDSKLAIDQQSSEDMLH
jgi:hypothetical protein